MPRDNVVRQEDQALFRGPCFHVTYRQQDPDMVGSTKDSRAKLTRWYMLLSELTFTIEHVPGKDNELPDTLLRNPCTAETSSGEPELERMFPPSRQSLEVGTDLATPTLSALYTMPLAEEVVQEQQFDPTICRDVERWRQLSLNPSNTQEDQDFLSNNHLDVRGFWRREKSDNEWRLQVPMTLRPRILWEFHDAPLSGHPGSDETIRDIRQRFFWPGMHRDIRRYVSGCHLCICCKPVGQDLTPNLRPPRGKICLENGSSRPNGTVSPHKGRESFYFGRD